MIDFSVRNTNIQKFRKLIPNYFLYFTTIRHQTLQFLDFLCS